MQREKIDAAVELANEFIKRAKMLKDAGSRDWMHPKESGALRRTSLDLTRALAEMRKP